MSEAFEFGARARECSEAAELCDDPWIAANVRELASAYRALAVKGAPRRPRSPRG